MPPGQGQDRRRYCRPARAGSRQSWGRPSRAAARYRYAVTKRVHGKFTGPNFVARGKSRPLKANTAPRDLPAALALHALPPIRRFEGLAAGEQRIIQERGPQTAVRLLHAQPATP